MKWFSLFSLISIFVFTSHYGQATSQVNLHGQWAGTGEMMINGEPSRCSSVEYIFEQSEHTLKVISSAYTCENDNSSYNGRTDYEIVGSNLVVNGQIIGTINDNQVHIKETHSQYEYEKTFQLENGQLIVSEFYLIDDMGIFKNSARLILQ